MNPAAQMERLARLHRQMLGLARAGLDLIGRGELEAWEDVCVQRRRLQRQAQAVGLGLRPLWADWQAGLARLAAADPDQARRLAELLAEIGRTGGQVLALDHRAAQALQAQMEAAREQIVRLEQGSRLGRAYGQALRPAASQPLQLSRTG
ncbi:MAG: hypothetical protein ACOZHQ_11925 [Thermodesulfobacteriota bacterium]